VAGFSHGRGLLKTEGEDRWKVILGKGGKTPYYGGLKDRWSPRFSDYGEGAR